MHRAVTAAFILITLSASALAQPFLDRVPDDASIYIAWKGADALGGGFDQSHLKAVLDASSARELFTEFLPALTRKIGEKDRKPAEIVQMISTLGGSLWKHPTAMYFTGVENAAGKKPYPKFTVLCEAGPNAQVMLNQVNLILMRAGQPIPATAKVEGNTFVLSTLPDPLAKPERPLAQSQSFAAATAQVQKDAVLTTYLDGPGLMTVINQLVAEEGDRQLKEKWPAVREALGLSNFRQFICTSGFDGKDWSTHAFLAAPPQRSGLMSLFSGKPIGDDVLKVVPRSATFVAASFFDLAALLAEIRSGVAKVDPQAAKQLEEGLAEVSARAGTNIETELINSLGDQWAAYFCAQVGGNGFLGLVLVNKPKDAAKLERALLQIQTAITSFIAQQSKGKDDPTIAFRVAESDGQKIHYLAIPFVSPAWTIKDGNFYMAVFPQVISSATRAAAGPSILENEDFKALRQRLGASNQTSIQFMDLPKVADEAYSMALAYSRLFLGMADMFNVPAPAMVVPPLDKLLPHLSVAGAVTYSDEAGIHYRAVTPFPGASLLGSPGQAMAGQNALLISILLPSLNRARETANRVKCASNQRQLAQGMLLYSNDNKGKLPPDLPTIYTTQDVSLDVFVCPSAGTQIPAEILSAPREAQAAWIAQNSDYIYTGRGKTNSAPADDIVLFEKLHDHDQDGINITYGDGHVEWHMMEGAIKELQRCNIPVPAME